MKNFCIFCGKRLVGDACSCADYRAYYGAPAPTAAPAPAPAPAPTPTAAPAPAAPKPASASTGVDSHFQSAGDL